MGLCAPDVEGSGVQSASPILNGEDDMMMANTAIRHERMGHNYCDVAVCVDTFELG